MELARIAPDLVFQGEKPRLISEWERATDLWEAIRYEVDIEGKKGQYILTQSSIPDSNSYYHSGAGRVGMLRMRTMSLFETGDSTGKVSLKDICDGRNISMMTGEVNLYDLAHLIIRGGFPKNISLSSEEAIKSNQEYLKDILDDTELIDHKKRDRHKMTLLLKSLTRNEGKTISEYGIQRDIVEKDKEDISRITIRDHLDVLYKLYLFDNDEPYSSNVRSSIRVKQQEKRHFADVSLACSLLNLTKEKLIDDLQTFGFLFESLVEHDLKVYASSFSGQVYHYQDYASQEIDSVIELPDKDYCTFDIVLGTYQIESKAKELIRFKNKIIEAGSKPPLRLCVICGLSNAAYIRNEGVYVVPITALKD